MEMFLLFWFPLSIAVGVYASNKGRSGFGLFLLSVFLSPVLGLLFAVALRNKAADQRHAELLEALRKATPPLPAQSIADDPEPARPLLTTYAIKDDASPLSVVRGISKGWIAVLALVAVAAAVLAFVVSPGSVAQRAERQMTDKYVALGYDVKKAEFRVTSPSTIEGTMLVNEPTGKPRYGSCQGTSTSRGSSYQITCK